MKPHIWFDNDRRLIDLLRANCCVDKEGREAEPMGSRSVSFLESMLDSARHESAEYWDRILSSQGMESPQPSVDSDTIFDAEDERIMRLADTAERAFWPKGQQHGKAASKPKNATMTMEELSLMPIAEPPARSVGGGVPKFSPTSVLQIVEKVSRVWNRKESECYVSGRGLAPLNATDIDHLSAAFDHMMWMFHQGPFPSKYDPGARGGTTSHNTDASSFPMGSRIPNYFANVVAETIHYRKLLSMAGLRNLLKEGPSLFKSFASGLYCHALCENTINKMREVTGNVVDLDTVVLRCSSTATLQVINASNEHKGLPRFRSTSEFANSKQAREIAVNCAHRCLSEFKGLLRLSDEDMRRRRSALSDLPTVDAEGNLADSKSIPTATNNADRGNAPLWRYTNAGQDSFHANVPVLEDIFGALIRAPVMCAHHYAVLFSGIYDKPTATGCSFNQCSPMLQQKLGSFFEDCVADSCFNMKWKSVEMFGQALAEEGTIRNVLAELQMRNQQLFAADLFDQDEANGNRDLEIATLWTVAEGIQGRSVDGIMRPITRADVERFVHST